MALQFQDIRCPRLEKKLQEGCQLGIFRSGNTQLLSRVTKKDNDELIVSELSDSLTTLIKKTEWQFIEDKLGIQKPFYKKSLARSALENLVDRGYSLGFNAKFSVLRGYLFDSNHNIVAYVKCLGSFSDTLQLLELEAIHIHI